MSLDSKLQEGVKNIILLQKLKFLGQDLFHVGP
jgi:hypothetical protein